MEVDRIIKSPDLQTRFIRDGLVPIGGTQKEFEKFIRAEIKKYAKVIRAAGLKPL
jgi:tripartite-type tricarboxylate transporter receptor subunit TctC